IDPEFIVKLREHGALEAVDVAAVHGFPLDWNNWGINEWPAQVRLIEQIAAMPVWVTEVGVSSFGAEEVQAFGIERTCELLCGVQRVYWYSLFDLPSVRAATTRHKESEGSAYYRHFHMGLIKSDLRTPKLALRHFNPRMGICQWFHYEDEQTLEQAVWWLKRLGVRQLRTGLSWADSHIPGAWDWFDRQMRALRPFDVMLTLCFTPPSHGKRPDHTSPPCDAGEYAYFCREVVTRYAPARPRGLIYAPSNDLVLDATV
ncbi:MAG: beta-xylosidase, partial [Candidatus Chloroheliales bacterium]